MALTPTRPTLSASDPERLVLERDLYRELLQLGASEDPRPFFEEALRLIGEATRSRQAYLALFDCPPGALNTGAVQVTLEPRFWLTRGCSADEVQAVRASLSRGIISEALRKGVTISTASAIDDPRFRAQESVAAQGLRAVLCAPIGDLGVLYLQGRTLPGPYLEADRRLLEDFAQQVLPYAARLLKQTPPADPTQPFRRSLKGLDSLAGRSSALASLFQQLSLVAPLDVTVLLRGPSGVGKTALARAIHANSRRVQGPFVELNCAALPEQLLESELFGAEKGAHSTADRRLPGKIEAAEGGTLFLDEVAELSPAAQSKLLQFLQSHQYYRLGSTRSLEADVRILVATNVDLEDAIRNKRFREDLFYRISVLPLHIPPLSERVDDIIPIAEALLQSLSRRHRLPELQLSSATRAALENTTWPGNVRQLAHVLEAGLIRAAGTGAAILQPTHLFPGSLSAQEPTTFHEATRSFQRRLLLETLQTTAWNVSESARRLDVSRSYLNELIRGFELRRPGEKGE